MTITEVMGFGRQKGHTEVDGNLEYAVTFLPKIKLEVVVRGSLAGGVIDAIMTSARTGQIGDGKIFVEDIASTMRVRTGETDDAAL